MYHEYPSFHENPHYDDLSTFLFDVQSTFDRVLAIV